MRATSRARSGVGPIFRGKAIGDNNKKVRGVRPKKEAGATGHIRKGKVRKNHGQKAEHGSVRNPLIGALQSARVVKNVKGYSTPAGRAERVRVGTHTGGFKR